MNKATSGLKPFARPVVRAYDALLTAISDEALDDEERAMGADTVAALMWYYGLTHPLMLALIFVGGTTARRAPAIARKVKARQAAKNEVGQTLQPVNKPQLVKPQLPPAPRPKSDLETTAEYPVAP